MQQTHPSEHRNLVSVDNENLQDSKILIVDDEKFNTLVVKRHLSDAGFNNFTLTSDSTTAVDLINRVHPDIILLDVMMPVVSGLDILAALKSQQDKHFVPIVVLTASTEPELKRQALDLGATDFLEKPVDPHDLNSRVRNSLVVKAHHDHLESYAEELNHQVALRTEELVRSREQIVHCLGRAAEYRDNETGRHVVRVGKFTAIIADQLGFDKEYVEMIELAAQLHDIGKIGIPDNILLNPAKLSDAQFEVMRTHCRMGREIIQPSCESEWSQIRLGDGMKPDEMQSDSEIMTLAASIAYSHHEKWDGSGYPQGLKGNEIPIEGRMTAVADVFDALSSKRPYKEPFPLDRCLDILQKDSGSHFDPSCVEAFLQRLDEVVRIQTVLSD